MKTLNSGFTLIELMVTLSVFAIVSTLAIPNVVQFFEKKNTQNEAQKIVAMMNEAREQAIKIKRTVNFHFASNGQHDSLTDYYIKSNELLFKNASSIQFDMTGRVQYQPSIQCIDVDHVNQSNYKMKLEITPLGEFSLVETDQGCLV